MFFISQFLFCHLQVMSHRVMTWQSYCRDILNVSYSLPNTFYFLFETSIEKLLVSSRDFVQTDLVLWSIFGKCIWLVEVCCQFLTFLLKHGSGTATCVYTTGTCCFKLSHHWYWLYCFFYWGLSLQLCGCAVCTVIDSRTHCVLLILRLKDWFAF